MNKRRAIILAFSTIAPVASLFVNAPQGQAATCANVRLYVDGSTIGPSNCGPTQIEDICFGTDPTVSQDGILDPTGVGLDVCVWSPVVR